MEGRRGIPAMCIHLLTLVGSQFIEQPIESVGRERRVNLCRAIMFTCAIPEQRFGVPRVPQPAKRLAS
jgi:hypothetical protein